MAGGDEKETIPIKNFVGFGFQNLTNTKSGLEKNNA
jgi:hypothetical protein